MSNSTTTAAQPPPVTTGRPRPVLLVRAEAGGVVGVGHVMRMLALAQAWMERGGVARFAGTDCPDALLARLEREGVSFSRLAACAHGSEEDAAQTIRLAREVRADWVALDGYGFGVEMQKSLRDAGCRVMAMDDYGHTPVWCADLILNQNYDATGRTYANTVHTAPVLRGPRFALLRREFRASPPPSARGGTVRRLLVTLGGVDAANHTGRVLATLEQIAGRPLELRVIAGPGNPHVAALGRLAAASRHRIEVVQDAHDMPAMYQWADAVVSAAGSTCYEWLRHGLPAAVLVVADNQQPLAAWLREKHAATVLPLDFSAGTLADWLRAAVVPPAGIVDGEGAWRVVDRLLAIVAESAAREVCHA